jgi:hypothetical protein
METGNLIGPALIGALIVACVGAILIAVKGMALARAVSIATVTAILINAVLAVATRDTVNQQAYLVLTVLVALVCAALLAIGGAVGSWRMRRGG